MLELGWTGRQLYGLLGALAARHPAESRPQLLKLLESPDPHARSWALLAVGAIGNPEDFDAMARCARRLPVAELNRAARAFEFLGDSRAVAVLRELAGPLPQGSQGDIEGSIRRLERGEPIRPE
jgi:HEAT repeat protein